MDVLGLESIHAAIVISIGVLLQARQDIKFEEFDDVQN